MLRTHPPSGKMPPPCILLEGETGSGRSTLTAKLSTDDRIGRMLWLELGTETTAEQYGAIPGVRYEILDPDSPDPTNTPWDYHLIYRAVCDAWSEAKRAEQAGEKPTVLVVDTVADIWDMLSEWADARTRATDKVREALEKDPNYEYTIGHDKWNAANARWDRLMAKFLTFPGVVILISGGSEVTYFDNGRPDKAGRTTWRVEGQKNLAKAMPIQVRMFQEGQARLIKFRSVTGGIRPGVGREDAKSGRALVGLDEKGLGWLIFERLGWDPGNTAARTIRGMTADGDDIPMDEITPEVLRLQIESAATPEQLNAVYPRIKAAAAGKVINQEVARELWQLANTTGRQRQWSAPPAAPTSSAPAGAETRANGQQPAGVAG